MSHERDDLFIRVSEKRLREDTFELVSIPSPPGEETAIAERYASFFEELDFDVQIDREFAESPSVIARHRGCDGPVLQLEGHLDAVPTKHDPPKIEGGRIYGRGSADMKSGLAGIIETCRVIKEGGIRCNLLITAHGQHEGAGSGGVLHAPLLRLLERGVKGDAVLIAEGPSDFVSIRSKGLAIFKFIITREGIPTHELRSEHVPNPIDAAYRIMHHYQEKKQEWSQHVDLELGSESFFIGSVVSGELYNTVPNICTLYGTRRNLPGTPFEAVEKELRGIARMVEEQTGTKIELVLWKSGQPYEIRADEPIVVSLRSAYEEVTGQSLPVRAWKTVGNTSQFVNIGKVAAVYHGVQGDTAHADVEWVEVAEIVRATKVYIATILNFFSQRMGK
jgi:acetylornithine deacetylase/succinyl-diaminopimelate desuccinylase-like protein